MHDNTLTADNMQKFVAIAKQYDQIVKFYNVEVLCADNIAEIKNLMPNIRTTIGTFYRFLVMDLLPDEITKIIYLDSDVIVNLDIGTLWQIELGDRVLAAANEIKGSGLVAENYIAICRDGFVKPENYFNAGVLIMNLKILRHERDKIREGIKFVAARPQYTNFDQDILNYCFSTQVLTLHGDFNAFVVHARRRGDYRVDNRICHYISTSLGLGVTMDMNDSFNRLFMKYFIKTPWFNVDAMRHLYEGTRQIYIERQNFATQISSIVSGKTRAFLIASPDTEMLKRIFYVNADEEYIVANSPESLQQMIRSLRNSNGKKVFFILVPEYLAVRQVLMQEGFTEGRDFLNAMMFLSDAHGIPLNSYPLIKLL